MLPPQFPLIKLGPKKAPVVGVTADRYVCKKPEDELIQTGGTGLILKVGILIAVVYCAVHEPLLAVSVKIVVLVTLTAILEVVAPPGCQLNVVPGAKAVALRV
jgi:hypothetical protein